MGKLYVSEGTAKIISLALARAHGRLTQIRQLTFTFLRNQMIVFLPVSFREPRKTTAPMHASGTPSGNLLGASGTAAKQKRAGEPSGFLPEASGTRLNRKGLICVKCVLSVDTGNKNSTLSFTGKGFCQESYTYKYSYIY